MKCNSYKKFFDTISNNTRLSIIEVLKEKKLSVSEICKILNEEQSKISHNLKCLADCNFIDVKKDGKRRIYSLNKETILPLMAIVEKHVNSFCCEKCNFKD